MILKISYLKWLVCNKMKLLNKKYIDRPAAVYNLHVKKNHNYIINGAVVSNCHGVRADTIRGLINDYGSHLKFRFGVTGTLPKPLVDQYHLKSSVGLVLTTTTARWLIDNGYLAEIEIDLFETQETIDTLPDFKTEKMFLSRDDNRIDLILDKIEECRLAYGNTLILAGDNTFGKKLVKAYNKKFGTDIKFLHGVTKNSDRSEEYTGFESEDNKLVIASVGIASTGISIDRVFCLGLVDIGKSFIRAIQSCGRGLRLAHDKKKVNVIDISSRLKYSRKHRRAREKWYKEAQYPFNKVVKLVS